MCLVLQSSRLCNHRYSPISTGKSDGHITTIDTLSDNVLLKIFDSFLSGDDGDRYRLYPVWTWRELLQVCRRWRQIVLESPRTLDLRIFCTNGTPVREILNCWPPFPIVIRYHHYHSTDDEDGVFAALEHPSRIRIIDLRLTGPQFDKVAAVMQGPFPALTYLILRCKGEDEDDSGDEDEDGNDDEDGDEDEVEGQDDNEDENQDDNVDEDGDEDDDKDQEDNEAEDRDDVYERASAVPGGFLGGSAPSLEYISFSSIPFPALPALLSSTSDLSFLELRFVPSDGYISPEALVGCLGGLPKLEYFSISVLPPDLPPDRIFPPHVTRTLLPALATIALCGDSEYIEDTISRVDSPRLKRFSMKYLEPFDFQIPQFFNFISRSGNPEISSSRHADVTFSSSSDDVIFAMYPHPDSGLHPVTGYIPCQGGIGRQLSCMAQVFSQHSAFLSRVAHLNLSQLEANEDRHDDEWLHLLRQFSAVRTLHVSLESAGAAALALEEITGEMIAEVLPVLDLIYLDGQPVSSVEKFLTARRLSGRPVAIVDTEAEFLERVKSYVSE